MYFTQRQEINWVSDWRNYIEHYNHFLIKGTTEEYIKANKLIVCDCDGVITDGSSTIAWGTRNFPEVQKSSKTYGAYDKEAIRFMISVGWEFKFVSSDGNGFDFTRYRIDSWLQGTYSDSRVLQRDWTERKALIDYEGTSQNRRDIILFIGDSVSDLYCLESKYLDGFYCPANAIKQVKNNDKVECVTELSGGHGALAETLYYIHNKHKDGFEIKAINNQTFILP